MQTSASRAARPGCGFGSAPQRLGRCRLLVAAAQRQKALNQVCVSKTLQCKPGKGQQVHKMCEEIVAFSEDAAKDKSSGIIVFQCIPDGWEPDLYHFWERYETKQAMSSHNTTPRMMTFMQQVQPHLVRPIGMALYEYNNGKIGTMCIAEGPKGEGGLDDATGAHGTAGGASMKQGSTSVGIAQLAEEDEHGSSGSEAGAGKKKSVEAEFMDNVTKKMQKGFQDAFKSLFAKK